jgi:hypothetical protein
LGGQIPLESIGIFRRSLAVASFAVSGITRQHSHEFCGVRQFQI